MTVSIAWDGSNGASGDGVIDTADTVANWTAVKITSGGQAPTAIAADAAFEGTNNVTCRSDNKRVYMYTDIGAGNTLDFTASGNAEGEQIYIWVNFLASSLLASQSVGGLGVFLESSTPSSTQYHLWYFYGNDNYNGGWKRLVLDPTKTASASNGTAIDLTAIRYIGAFAQTTATAKFDNFVVDQCAVGKGLIITGTSTLGLMEELLTDEETNRHGVLTSINDSGTAYELAGTLTLGDNVGIVASNISDEDSKIFIAEPLYYQASVKAAAPLTFAGISVVGNGTGNTDVVIGQQVGTTQGRNGIALIGNDTYTFDFDTDDAAVESSDWFGCSYENLTGTLNLDGSHNFDSATMVSCAGLNVATAMTINNLTSVTSGKITLNGSAKLKNSLIINNSNSKSCSTSTLANITGNDFTSDGSNHAVDLGTIGSDQTMTWDNLEGSYVTGSSGTNVGVTPTGNETILVSVSSGFTLTINIATGASIPSVADAGTGGQVDVVSGQVTTLVVVKDGSNSPPTLITDSLVNVIIEAAAGGPLAVGTDIIKGFTDVNGEIQDVRSLASNQPITGWARKGSSGSTYYKQADISSTIDSSNGVTITVLMQLDQ